MRTNKFNFLLKNALNGNIKDSRTCYRKFEKSEKINFWEYLNGFISVDLLASVYFCLFGYKKNFSDIKFNEEDKQNLINEINKKYNTDFV